MGDPGEGETVRLRAWAQQACADARAAWAAAVREGGGPAAESAAQCAAVSGAGAASRSIAVVAHLSADRPAPPGCNGASSVPAPPAVLGGRIAFAATVRFH